MYFGTSIKANRRRANRAIIKADFNNEIKMEGLLRLVFLIVFEALPVVSVL